MTGTFVRIYLIYMHLLCFQVTGGKMQHNFFKALSFKHKLGVFKIELRLTREKYGEKCQIAVEACVFLKSKKLKKEKEMACFIPLS